MINELLRPKYSDITFYCNNLGGYDVVFILKIKYYYNESIVDNDLKYKIFPILRDDKILIQDLNLDPDIINTLLYR